MRKPKPPTARSVSATLRNAGYRAARWERRGESMGYSEGYRVSPWTDVETWRLDFMTDDPDLHKRALVAMTDTLTRKGWKVSAASESRFLLVTAMEGQR